MRATLFIGSLLLAAAGLTAGQAPAATASGSSVAVSWPAATFPDGAPVAGYIVRRYNAATGGQETTGAACSGTITSTSCTESAVSAGSWVYTDTPVQANWTGTGSPASASVTVSG
jgi:hypothetical protein